MIHLVRSLALLVLLVGSAMSARAQATDVKWGPLSFLLGDWVGEGTGADGLGFGGTSFAFDLDKRVIIRRNRAEYPATKDHKAVLHTDLMTIYFDPNGSAKAIYFDNEGNVINYVIKVSMDETTIVFLSNAVSGSPRFRFTNKITGPSTMDVIFEIAPPGKPEAFAIYTTGKLKRK